MSKRIQVLAVVSGVLLTGLPAWGQTTWHVDDDAPNDPGPGDPTISDPAEDGSPEHPFDAIQEAIGAAVSGDEALVADGTYTGSGNKELDFGGREITVRSLSGPENCIIDCEGSGRGFFFHSGEGPAAMVEGFTITNGYAVDGGGIRCDSSSPTITNCIISNNFASDYGGGIYCDLNSPTITNCVISNNAAYGGGGICCRASSPAITNCTISNNTAGYGGGIYCFQTGECPWDVDGNGVVEPFDSGAVMARYGSTDPEDLLYYDLDHNGVIDPFDSNAVLAHFGPCPGSSPTITNCILWGDSPEEVYIAFGSPVITYSDIEGGWSGEGNIDADPAFAFDDDGHLMPDSPCVDAGTNDPVGGLPSDDIDGNPRPLDGNEDSIEVADMGAYEFNPQTPSIAVPASTIEFTAPEGGPNPEGQAVQIRNCGGGTLNWEVTEDCPWLEVDPLSGSSTGEIASVDVGVDPTGLTHGQYSCTVTVADPAAVNSPRTVRVVLYVNTTLHVPAEYPTIQEAINATTVDHDVVLVADGTYTGIGNKNLDFRGKAITLRSQNGAESCLIDCEDDGRGFYFHSGEGPAAVVEGFTITNGYANDYGGGIYCYLSSPTITDCTISGNTAVTDVNHSGGGGVYCLASSPTIAHCTISGNTAASDVAYNGGGGGICCFASSPTITDCTISGNTAVTDVVDGRGGGVFCRYGHPTIANCTISNNATGSDGYGGGFYGGHESDMTITNCTISGNTARTGGGIFGSPTITNCTIAGNTASVYGGGIRGNPAIINCTISDNTASSGGGIYCTSFDSSTITNCTISDNTASSGGGIFCSGGQPTIANCTISNNATGSDGYGGGIYCSYASSPTIANCAVSGNTAYSGGGIYCSGGHPTITNCVIASNTTDDAGGGIYCYLSSPTITNCTFVENSATNGTALACDSAGRSSPSTVEAANCILWDGGDEIWNHDGSTITIRYSDVFGGWPGDGNIDAEPTFAFGDDGHLMPDSPCIDAGTNDPFGGLPPDDLDGNLRPLDGDGDLVAVADMGAYEFNPDASSIALSPTMMEFIAPVDGPNPADQAVQIRNCGGGTLNWEIMEDCPWLEVDPPSGGSTGEIDSVDISVDPTGLGHGEHSCTVTVTDPDAVNSPRTVRVVFYVYAILHVPAEYPTIQEAINAIALKHDLVAVADGTYTGSGNKDLDFGGREITVRSLSGPENCIIDCENDGRGFYFHSGEGPAAVVQGFTITNGYTDGDGGGIYCYLSSPTITDCTISGNTADYNGGGLYCDESSPTITNCTISGNMANDYRGGGIYCDYSNPTIINCAVSNNDVDGYGGGIHCHHSHPTITNCTISDNTAYQHDGGGISCYFYSSPTITNCTISGNTAYQDVGGGISCYFYSNPTIANCVLWGDSPDEVYVLSGSAVITFSDIEGGWPGDGNIDENPLFVDPDGPDGIPGTEDDDFRLLPGSPCIDAADNTAVPEDVTDLDGDGDTTERTPLDLDLASRFVNDPDTDDTGVPDLPEYPEIVDMGAYEFPAGQCP